MIAFLLSRGENQKLNRKETVMRKVIANALLRVVVRAYKLDDTM